MPAATAAPTLPWPTLQAALDAAQQNVTFYETQVSTVKEIMLEHNRALWEGAF